MLNKIYVTYKQIEDLIRSQVDLYKLKSKKFDCILSVGRGGLVPARLYSELLGIKQIEIFNISSYEGEKSGKINFEGFDFNRIKGKKVLIVDDVRTTGNTLFFVESYLKDHDKKIKYKMITLFSSKLSNSKHILNGQLYNPNTTWIVFPWEINDLEPVLHIKIYI